MKRYSLWVKSIVFFLAVVTLLAVAVSGLGIVMAETMNMYTQNDYESWMVDQYEGIAHEIAYQAMHDYSGKLSGCPDWLLEQAGYFYAIENVKGWHNLEENDFYYRIQDVNGKTVYETDSQRVEDPLEFAFGRMDANYLEIVARVNHSLVTESETEAIDVAEGQTAPPAAEATIYYENDESYWDPETGEEVYVRHISKDGFQVNVGISRKYMGAYRNNGFSQDFIQWLFSVKYLAIAVTKSSLATEMYGKLLVHQKVCELPRLMFPI